MTIQNNSKIDAYRDRIDQLQNLPTVPVIATQLLEIISEDKASVKQLLPIIEKDPSLALKILHVANSAYYGLFKNIDSLRQAVVLIGLTDLYNLVLGFSVIKSFNQQVENSKWVDWNEFWGHSVTAGSIAQLIKTEFRLPMLGNPYALGLLHDIGKLVLFQIARPEYMETLKIQEEQNRSSSDVEMEIMGIDHSLVGSWLAERWQLPESVVETMATHHKATPEDSEYLGIVALITIADHLSHRLEKGFISHFSDVTDAVTNAWNRLCIHYPQLAAVDMDILEQLIRDKLPPTSELMFITRS
ncbi:MAG: HDOD domain-containing protein [Candidatus Marinimicrobia bacterium]|nr:HDOD domain-containing protein [Candidatus Neomarinimicrobiota bacterium]